MLFLLVVLFRPGVMFILFGNRFDKVAESAVNKERVHPIDVYIQVEELADKRHVRVVNSMCARSSLQVRNRGHFGPRSSRIASSCELAPSNVRTRSLDIYM